MHLRTHSANRARSVSSKYRSAIYVNKYRQRSEAQKAIDGLEAESATPVQNFAEIALPAYSESPIGLRFFRQEINKVRYVTDLRKGAGQVLFKEG